MGGGSIGTDILAGAVGQATGALVPSAEFVKGIIQLGKRTHDYIKNLDLNYETLMREAEYLSSREEDVKHEIDDNILSMRRTQECGLWLTDVQTAKHKVEELKKRYTDAMNGGYGFNFVNTRMRLSAEIEEMKNSIVDLKSRMDIDHAVRKNRCPDRVGQRSLNNIIQLPSQCQHVEKLLEFFRDDSIKKIGIWGMCGVGKTTILESLHEELAKHKDHGIVIWVNVSEKPNFQEMQEKILKRLRIKIDLENEAEDEIAKSLESKKYVLLLDDVFSDVDLHRLGFRETHQCKVVLATRERGICRLMNTQEEIKVEKLSRKDASDLFRSIVGDVVDHNSFEGIAKCILKQCGDLPEIIRIVGMHLKGNNKLYFWEETLKELQSPIMRRLTHLEDVLKSFEMVFEKLDSISKDCLLHGAVFPEDHEIYRDYLVECWMAHELVSSCDTFRSARSDGYTSLDTFIGKCLFDSCRDSKAVKMPIMFRKTALRIAKQCNFELLENPRVESWTQTNAKVISLMNSDLEMLPDGPSCCMLSTLFLQQCKSLSMIPLSFFNSMSALKILDLHGTRISGLPSSISNLNSLRALYLNNCCNLVHLPDNLDRLQILEFLDIRRIGIQGFGVPAVLGRLISLKCLRVSFISVVERQNGCEVNATEATPSSPIQQLFRLEELSIDVDPNDTPSWNVVAPGIAAEVASLEKLSTLSFYFSSIDSFETFTQNSMSWKSSSPPGSSFRAFNIYIGKDTFNSPELNVTECSAPRHLYYSGGSDIPNSIKEVLRLTTAFEFINHQTITSFSELGVDVMEPLEVCRVKKCHAMVFFLSSQTPASPVFRWLRELQLLHLEKMNLICQGPIMLRSFEKLTTLSIEDCPNLIEVASWEMASLLHELQHLRVKGCPLVTEIVAGSNQSASTGASAFLKLKRLELIDLEGLVSILSEDTFIWRELQDVDISQCNNLVNLCLTSGNAKRLRSIECNEAWWQGLNQDFRSDLQGFVTFL